MNKNLVILITAMLLNSCAGGQTKPGEAKLSAIAFSEKINATRDVVIIDVRTPEEFENGHIENALNLNWNGAEFEQQVATLDKSQPVFVYCLSGVRSRDAANKMRKEGFEKVVEMPGGMIEWRANNLPETRKKADTQAMSLAQYQALLDVEKLVLVDFYADWCAPCKKMKPYLEKIAVDLADQVILVRMDADENAALCKELNVTALPVLKLYKDNQLVWRNEGYIGEAEVKEQIKKYERAITAK